MTYVELITTIIALVALIISAAALHRAGRANRIAEEANELAQAPAKLAKVQLEQEETRRGRTSVSLTLVERQSIGSNGRPLRFHKFRLSNDGESSAQDAGFEIKSNDSPLVLQDYQDKLPATLNPNQTIEVMASVHLGSPSKLDAVIFWTNADGSEEQHECVVTM